MKIVQAILFIHLFVCLGFAQEDQEAKYDYIASFGEHGHASFAVVRLENRYGLIDRQGKEVIPPEYDKIYSFGSSGLNWAKVQKNNRYGFIDRTGAIIIKPIYDRIYSFGDKNVNWALVLRDGLYGFIGRSGAEVVPTIYSD